MAGASNPANSPKASYLSTAGQCTSDALRVHDQSTGSPNPATSNRLIAATCCSSLTRNLVTDSTTVGSTMLPRLQADQANARRSGDKDLVILLGMLISEIKNREIELRRDINDDDATDVLRKAIKRRKEAVTVYEKANRADLAAKEQGEASSLEQYLPPQVNTDELRAAIVAAVAGGAANVGAVMAKVMPQFKGKADGSSINALAREVLAAGK